MGFKVRRANGTVRLLDEVLVWCSGGPRGGDLSGGGDSSTSDEIPGESMK